MNMMTVSEVSKLYSISTRMLRYYESLGLIHSSRRVDYAYRIYDDTAVRRLQQIIILRKLHIPLKQIALILDDREQKQAIQILKQNLADINAEINSLDKISSILNTFVNQLNACIRNKIQHDFMNDTKLIEITKSLSLPKFNLKENIIMNETNNLRKNLDVRMVLLPPCTIASYQYTGENPEDIVGDVMDKFIRESNLYELKPDARFFGFNNPVPPKECTSYGYECWVTIPDDMVVPEPLVKKTFNGGLYAAHTIDFPNFEEWQDLISWVDENDIYCPDFEYQGNEVIHGCLEEGLNWVYSSHMRWPENGIDGRVDLLLPIKRIHE